jgi:hypothetical protein
MSPDAVFVDQHAENPQSWNLYTYVRNNPLINIDPDGECTKDAQGNFQGDDCYESTGTGDKPDQVIVKPGLENSDFRINWPWLHPTETESQRRFHAWLAAQGIKEVRAEIPFVFGSIGSLSAAEAELSYTAKLSGILREAAANKGMGPAAGGEAEVTASEAEELGKAWVGPGARVASDGKSLVSDNGLRVYRPPTFKPGMGRVQANLEQKAVSGGRPISNFHLDIK